MADRTATRPKKILLGTDLSARSDRALDRAALLAAEWDAELVVLHVLEEERSIPGGVGPIPSWRRPPNPQAVAERRLKADLRGLHAPPVVVIGKGEPGEVILRTAEARECDLVVTGLARDELLGRFSHGATVDLLLRRSSVPLLIVKDRARGPYLDIVVAADFSDTARLAIETAGQFFPQRRLTVFHAYDPPMAVLLQDPEIYRRNYADLAAAEYRKFLQTVRLPPGEPPSELIEWGEPGRLLRELAGHRDIDLVALGTHGRGALFEAFIGSTAKQILSELPCDALVVPAGSGMGASA